MGCSQRDKVRLMPSIRVSSEDVDLVSSNPDLLSEFVRRYDGTNNPLDALWWMNHPMETAPSGRPSPLKQVRALEAIVYGQPSPTRLAATERHRGLVEAIEAEGVRTRAAIDAVLAAERQGRSEAAYQAHLPISGDVRVPKLDGPTWGLSRKKLATGVLAVAVVGALLGIALGSQIPKSAVDATGALAIFDKPQTAIDLPPVALDAPGLSVQSFRTIADSVSVYAARGTNGKDVCLVLVQPTGRSAASCVPADSFPRGGLNIKGSYQNPGSIQPDDPAAGVFRQVDVTWLPDGRIFVTEQPDEETSSDTAG